MLRITMHFRAFFSAAIVAVSFAAQAQNPLPSAPEAPTPTAPITKPVFTLPTSKPDLPKGPAPQSAKDGLLCNALREGIFTEKHPDFSLTLQGQIRNYTNLLGGQIVHEWSSHMSLSEKNAWAQNKVAMVRFAVYPDGTYTRPAITLSSGNDHYDDHLLRAITAHASFDPLPGNLQYPVPVCLRFSLKGDGAPLDRYDQWQEQADRKQKTQK